MDPPYQGVCSNRDQRYYSRVELEELSEVLEDLVNRKISFILSYDGRTGQKIHGKELPTELGLYRIEIRAGRSSQSTLLGRREVTYESIYLSQGLVDRLTILPEKIAAIFTTQREAPILRGLEIE